LTWGELAKVNYKHLHYFWMTSNMGGFLRASQRKWRLIIDTAQNALRLNADCPLNVI
jgi:hypothetical protein